MGTRLLILADTHWPRRAKALPAPVWAAVSAADVVVHAGDWVEEGLLDELGARSRRLLACWGNNDSPALRRRLPQVARATIDGVRLAVVHETGPAAGRERRADSAFADVDLLLFGHSHVPWDSVTPRGMRLLNPGSPTDRRRQPQATFMTAELVPGVPPAELRVTLHRLPARTVAGAGGTDRGLPGLDIEAT